MEEIRKRFFKYVRKTKTCWMWNAGTMFRRYGQFKGPFGERLAHRTSWILHYGKIPPGLYVCHKCDVPLCVNPKHLFLGTNTDNLQDMSKKGRSLRGEKNPNNKITQKQAEDIKYSTDTQVSLAKRYGVTQAAVSSIKRGKMWKHV